MKSNIVVKNAGNKNILDTMKRYNRSMVWFRNDLRIHDNQALSEMALESREMIPVYCFDSRHFEKSSFGFPKTGKIRLRFLVESVLDLKKNLQDRGSDLLVLFGDPENIIPEIANSYNVENVIWQDEVASEETDVDFKLRENLEQKGIDTMCTWGLTLYHVDESPFDYNSVPDVFTAFRKKVEKSTTVSDLYMAPKRFPAFPNEVEGYVEIPTEIKKLLEKSQYHPDAVLSFKGGESEALKRLDEYFWEGDHLKHYKETRNGLLGADYSSKFSPWLANGCISPRYIYHQVKKYEAARVANDSTYWLVFELIWRDYFKCIFLKYDDKLFMKNGIKNETTQWKTDNAVFEKWANGNTGIPFIDANMRELNATGYMSNRGRQNVASFFAKNLELDWRMGAEYFESMLIDYDVCSNYGNWAYVSGVGNDPRDRYFNIVGQAKRYDNNGEYVRTWLPELHELPSEYIHEPHKMLKSMQEIYGVTIGKDYPEPMIDLEKSYERIKSGR